VRSTEQALRDAVLQRLAMLDEISTSDQSESLLPLARSELQRLANGWRLLLTVHQPDEDHRCRACPKSFLTRRRRWPCRVWLMAYQHLIGEGMPNPKRHFWLRRPDRRPPPPHTEARDAHAL
jgi:hypothetical protein